MFMRFSECIGINYSPSYYRAYWNTWHIEYESSLQSKTGERRAIVTAIRIRHRDQRSHCLLQDFRCRTTKIPWNKSSDVTLRQISSCQATDLERDLPDRLCHLKTSREPTLLNAFSHGPAFRLKRFQSHHRITLTFTISAGLPVFLVLHGCHPIEVQTFPR